MVRTDIQIQPLKVNSKFAKLDSGKTLTKPDKFYKFA